MRFINLRRLSLHTIWCLLFMGVISLPSQAQSPTPSTPETQTESSNSVDSFLSIQGGQNLMTEANKAIEAGDYTTAVNDLQKARLVFNQLTNFHLDLAKSFSGIDNNVTEAERNSAAETGQLRDEATYQLALVHRAQNKPELAVPLLIQVIRSQNPTSELGKKSYQQLYELGFTKVPFSGTVK